MSERAHLSPQAAHTLRQKTSRSKVRRKSITLPRAGTENIPFNANTRGPRTKLTNYKPGPKFDRANAYKPDPDWYIWPAHRKPADRRKNDQPRRPPLLVGDNMYPEFLEGELELKRGYYKRLVQEYSAELNVRPCWGSRIPRRKRDDADYLPDIIPVKETRWFPRPNPTYSVQEQERTDGIRFACLMPWNRASLHFHEHQAKALAYLQREGLWVDDIFPIAYLSGDIVDGSTSVGYWQPTVVICCPWPEQWYGVIIERAKQAFWPDALFLRAVMVRGRARNFYPEDGLVGVYCIDNGDYPEAREGADRKVGGDSSDHSKGGSVTGSYKAASIASAASAGAPVARNYRGYDGSANSSHYAASAASAGAPFNRNYGRYDGRVNNSYYAASAASAGAPVGRNYGGYDGGAYRNAGAYGGSISAPVSATATATGTIPDNCSCYECVNNGAYNGFGNAGHYGGAPAGGGVGYYNHAAYNPFFQGGGGGYGGYVDNRAYTGPVGGNPYHTEYVDVDTQHGYVGSTSHGGYVGNSADYGYVDNSEQQHEVDDSDGYEEGVDGDAYDPYANEEPYTRPRRATADEYVWWSSSTSSTSEVYDFKTSKSW
ncbi:hypothetical protein TWF696_003290 [Orbilia brochopaga]|uniref:Uncharacterized protein n=1 Tax=Orbilia brochopaga TaxID=3140254 RepID=A0AAV9U1T0_9PEZI